MAQPTIAPTETGRGWTLAWVAPAVAAAMTVLARIFGWKGDDLPAQLYRVTLFHQLGMTLWDSQWYGGHWTFNYSVLFPPIAGTIGVGLTEIGCVVVAAWSFDRIVVPRLGYTGRVASIAFALGTLVQVSIGQLPFLLGEALGVSAYLAADRKRYRFAIPLAIATSLASPEAGAFLAFVLGVAWLTSGRRDLRLIVTAAVACVPVGLTTLLFPGQGKMPFPFVDFAVEGTVFLVAAIAISRSYPVLKTAAWLYMLAFVGSFILQSPSGGNIERLGELLAMPLVIIALWPVRKLALAIVAIPIAILQWGPAVAEVTANRTNAAAQQSYFNPLLDYIGDHAEPPGRVEIVPTALHWEAAYAAPELPLARGWERQLDTADNPLFYEKGGLTATTYYQWLLDNGVRFVALPDVKLDYAAVAEGALVRAGVPGLTEVWTSPHWRLYAVNGSPGLVTGPARLVHLDGGEIDLDVTAPGTIHVKERYSSKWTVVQGRGCLFEDPGGWLGVTALQPGPLRADIRIVGPPGDAC